MLYWWHATLLFSVLNNHDPELMGCCFKKMRVCVNCGWTGTCIWTRAGGSPAQQPSLFPSRGIPKPDWCWYRWEGSEGGVWEEKWDHFYVFLGACTLWNFLVWCWLNKKKLNLLLCAFGSFERVRWGDNRVESKRERHTETARERESWSGWAGRWADVCSRHLCYLLIQQALWNRHDFPLFSSLYLSILRSLNCQCLHVISSGLLSSLCLRSCFSYGCVFFFFLFE